MREDSYQAKPAERPADAAGETVQQTIRELRLAARQDDEKSGTDIIAFLVIVLLVGLAFWGAYELWMLVLSAPSHANSAMGLLLPG